MEHSNGREYPNGREHLERSGPTSAPGSHVVGVEFRPAGKLYEFDPGSLILTPGDLVVVETERGPALGIVSRSGPGPTAPGGRLQKVMRKADARDLARDEIN